MIRTAQLNFIDRYRHAGADPIGRGPRTEGPRFGNVDSARERGDVQRGR